MNVISVARFSLSFRDRDLPWRLTEYHLKNHHGNDVVFKVMMAFHLISRGTEYQNISTCLILM